MNVFETIEDAGGRTLIVERPGGIQLRAARFDPDAAAPRGDCLFLSGYTEFIEKNLESIGELTARGFRVATLDWRGQGLSSRLLVDRHKGHIDRMETHLEDLEAVLDALDGFGSGPLTVMGHSMGGHMALRWCLVRPERVARAVLIAPMLGIGRSGLPTWLAHRLVEWLHDAGFADRYIFGGAGYGPHRRRFSRNVLTHDPHRFERMHRLMERVPDLAVSDPTFAWVRAAFRSIATVTAPGVLERIATPILLAEAGREAIVSNRAIRLALARLPDARLVTLPDAKHEILNELEPVRQRFWAAVDEFLVETAR